MIETLLVDIGNVLTPFDFEPALREFRRRSDRFDERAPGWILRVKNDFERGHVSPESFVREAIDDLGFHGSAEEFTAIWKDIFVENEAFTALVRSLEGRLPLYLLSNTNALHLEHLRERFPVFGCFQGGVFSHLAHSLKPEEEIYRQAIEAFSLRPGKTVFVDDLKDNVEAAIRLGFHAIQYDHRDHESFLEALARAGLPV